MTPVPLHNVFDLVLIRHLLISLLMRNEFQRCTASRDDDNLWARKRLKSIDVPITSSAESTYSIGNFFVVVLKCLPQCMLFNSVNVSLARDA